MENIATIWVASILKNLNHIKNYYKQRSKCIMGMTEFLVVGFLAMLGFLAYTNSRKVSRELKKLGIRK